MKKGIRTFLFLGILVSCFAIQSCNDDVGPASQCNNCDADFPWSTDGSDTCYQTQSICESNEGVDCFLCR